MTQTAAIITGRFAPTPSGPLHFGSLVTAVASYCHARTRDGQWLLRIEDLDTPRVIPGAADNILYTLDAFGFEWHGEVLFQSHRFPVYEEVLQNLIQQGVVYACSCSRKSLLKNPHQSGVLGIIYPGHCRHKKLNISSSSLRLNVDPSKTIHFIDANYGNQQINLVRDVGDVVVKRIDGIYAYHLAVVIDDACQQINQIVRGRDLLEVSFIHLHLNHILGYTNANYLHIPLVNNEHGEKLSKQTGAQAIQVNNATELLIRSINFLGQHTPADLVHCKPSEILDYAIKHWDSRKIPC